MEKTTARAGGEAQRQDPLKIFFLVTLAVLISTILSNPAHALDVPTPQGYVTDTAGALSLQEKVQLEDHISDIEKNTTAEIAVLIIPSLENETLEDYANRVFRTWGVGKSDVNNGVLILVAVNDHRMRIEVGYGMEGAITDAQTGIIINDIMAPAFRQGDYAGGLTKAVDALAGLAQGDPNIVSQYRSGDQQQIAPSDLLWTAALCIAYLVLAIIVAVKWKKDKKRSWAWNGGGFVVVVIIAFVIGAIVGWITAFVCFWILAIVMAAASAATGGKGGGSGLLWLGGLGGGRGGLGGGGGGFGGFGGGSSGGGGGSGGW